MYQCSVCKEQQLYTGRNCEKFFPERERLSGYRWEPDYRTVKGTPFSVSDVSVDECPKSFVKSESIEWLGARQRLVRSAKLGVQVFQPGLVLARTMDALLTIESEESKLDHARWEAEQSEHSSDYDDYGKQG